MNGVESNSIYQARKCLNFSHELILSILELDNSDFDPMKLLDKIHDFYLQQPQVQTSEGQEVLCALVEKTYNARDTVSAHSNSVNKATIQENASALVQSDDNFLQCVGSRKLSDGI